MHISTVVTLLFPLTPAPRSSLPVWPGLFLDNGSIPQTYIYTIRAHKVESERDEKNCGWNWHLLAKLNSYDSLMLPPIRNMKCLAGA